MAKWAKPKYMVMEPDYIDLGIGSEEEALSVKYDGSYLWVGDMVFDVWMADYAPGAFLRIIRERGNKSTAVEALPDKVGRTFVLNTDGTISPKGQPKLVFGIQRCLFRVASILVSQYHPAVSQYPSILGRPNFGGLVLGCIEADFCK